MIRAALAALAATAVAFAIVLIPAPSGAEPCASWNGTRFAADWPRPEHCR